MRWIWDRFGFCCNLWEIVWRNWKGICSKMICAMYQQTYTHKYGKSMQRIILHTRFLFLTYRNFTLEYQNWRLMCIIFTINHTLSYSTFQFYFCTFMMSKTYLWMQKYILFMQVCSQNCDIFIDMFSRLPTISVKYIHAYHHFYQSQCTWIIGTFILNEIVHLSLDLSSVQDKLKHMSYTTNTNTFYYYYYYY